MHKILQRVRRFAHATTRTQRQHTSTRAQLVRCLIEPLESRQLLASDFALTKDITPGPSSTDPSFAAEVSGTIYFSANGELWKSDGTTAGTTRVIDINVGGWDSVSNLTNVNGTLYFNATDGATGYELWRSDGTAAGTEIVKDILPGAGGSGPQWLTNVNGTLFFSAISSGIGQELWKSDGTAAGTVLIKDIRPGNFSSSLRYFTNVNGTLFFDANDGVTSLELWKSDGTLAGTQLVKDINPGTGFGSPKELANINGTLFFGASDGTTGEEIWKSDGTVAGTTRVFDITPGSAGSLPRYVTNVNGLAYFAANNGVHGRELWKSDGTASGTMMVKDIWPGAASGSPNAFQGIGSTVYFSSSDGVNGFEFWKSDGTTAGTVMVKDINPGPGESAPRSMIDIDGLLYMTADDGVHGYELWTSDGTNAGTQFDFDFSGDASNGMPSRIIVVGENLFAVATAASTGRELYAAIPQVEHAPTDITLVDSVIDENAPSGTLVGTLTTIDADAGDEFVYALTGGLGSDDNGSFTLESDGRLLSAAGFDFEAKSSYSIRVLSIDSAGLSTEKSITIAIADMYEFGPAGLTDFQLVKDINTQSITNTFTNPNNITSVGAQTFFTATTPDNGNELWATDGTPTGTRLVRDIVAGSVGSNISKLTNVNGILYFSVATTNYELWKSDGTEAGTVLVKDMTASDYFSYLTNLTNINGQLYFNGYDTETGVELWKSDGTASGTMLIADIRPGYLGSYPTGLTNFNGDVYFRARADASNMELWKSDGTSAGTTMVKDIRPGPLTSAVANLTTYSGSLYFTANDGVNGIELWKSDGTAAGTSLVADIRPGAVSSSPTTLVDINGLLYFRANDGVNGIELWKSDGTTLGTSLVADINSGTGSSSPSSLVNVNGTIYFSATDGVNGGELWATDGTSTGTTLVKDIFSGPSGSYPQNLTVANGSIYFAANDGVTGLELWKSDGSSSGTTQIKDIKPGTYGSISISSGFVNSNGVIFFRAEDDSGFGIWRTDGTGSGTLQVTNESAGTASADPTFPTNVNGTLYFSAYDTTNGQELWKSDGTPSGTEIVADIFPGSVGSSPSSIINVSGTLFFVANDGTHGSELWKSDGTPAGTVMVKDINTGSGESSATWLTNVNGVLYFVANNGVSGNELWKSDGTASGTVQVADIRSGSLGANPAYFVNVNGLLFFRADDGVTGLELWKSDGTAAGTVLLNDFNVGAASSIPGDMANVNGWLYFSINAGVNSLSLWKSDGTLAGTTLVKANQGAQELVSYGDKVIFRGHDGGNNFELWITDGTTAGTALVKDINPLQGSYPTNFTNVNGHIYFSANLPNGQSELWKTDGTTAGTTRVKSGFLGTNTLALTNFTFADETLFFRANDGVHADELWKTDGTETGTVLAYDFNSGSGSSSLAATAVGDKLFVIATTPAFGRELFVTAPNLPPTNISLSSSIVQENQPVGTLIGTLFTTDPNSTDAFQHTLVSGTGSDDNANFSLDSNGQLVSLSVFDFEIKASYSIRVRSTDIEGLSTEKTFQISVSNVDEYAASVPIDVDLATNVVTENAAVDTLVGITAFSQDLDGPTNTITYSLQNNAGGLFKIDGTTGVVRVASTGIDYEAAYEHIIVVRASSSDGSFADQLFQIAIANVNENNDVELNGTSGDDQFDVRFVGSGNSSWIVSLNGLQIFSGVVPTGGRLVLLGASGHDTLTQIGRASADTFVIDGATIEVNSFSMASYHIEQRLVRGEGGNDLFRLVSGNAAIDGGPGTDRLQGNDVGNQFSIASANGGSLNDNSSFTAIETLTGGNGADDFHFLTGGSLTGQVQGGSGSDRLSYATRATAANVNLNNNTATSSGGWISIESFVGSSTTGDVLIGRNVSNTWLLDGYNHGQVNGEFSFDGVENLTGASQSDAFVFANSTARAAGLVQGNGGSDSLDFAAISDPVQINLATASSDRVGSFASIESAVGSSSTLDTLTGIDGTNAWTIQGANQGTVRSFAFSGIETLIGGAGADTFTLANTGASVSGAVVGNTGVDTLVGANQNNDWTIESLGGGVLNTMAFQSMENLTGNSAIDLFQFAGAGHLPGTLQAGSQPSGTRDVLSYANYGTEVSVDLQTRSGTGLGQYIGIEEVRGATTQSSSLLGADAANNWSITTTNSGTVGTMTFSQFNRLVGGSLADRYSLSAGASVTGVIDGSDGNDTLIGAAINTAWQVMSLNQGRLETSTDSALFQNVESLTGGSAVDTFVFSPPGGISETILGGGGTDTLDLAQAVSPVEIINSTNKSVTNLLGSFSAIEQVLAGDDVSDRIVGSSVNTTWQFNATGQIVVSGVAYGGFDIVQGGSAIDTLTGPNLDTNWTIDGAGIGQLSVGVLVLNFESVENLTGGTANDHFEIQPTGLVTGNLNGGTGAGINSLSYSSWSSDVSVTLSSAVAGNASAVTGTANNLTVVTGGAGNDFLKGNNGRSSVLIGGDGSDTLLGLSARDILIGGLGVDTISGVGGEDLLIAGRTQHDYDRAALLAIMAEWTNTSRNFSTRVSNLLGTGTGTRLNGSAFLNVDSVFNDAESIDSLTGGASSDWFFADATEITDFVTTGNSTDRRN